MSTNSGGVGAEVDENGRRPSPPPGNTRLRVRPDPFLFVCRIFSVITALTAVLCIVVNVFSAIQCFKDGSDVFDGIFRCYAVLIAMIVVVAETEWAFIIKFWKVLEYWVGRGMLQIFVAVMTRAFPNDTGTSAALVLLQNIASYMLLACGGVYIILGILCFGFLKRSRQKTEISREQAVKDLEDLQREGKNLSTCLLRKEIKEICYHRQRKNKKSCESCSFLYLIPLGCCVRMSYFARA